MSQDTQDRHKERNNHNDTDWEQSGDARRQGKGGKQKGKKKTYNSRCSLVVTHPTTNLPVSGLSMGEQTGP
ncbi:hypothetical protein CI102_14833, partial [Trichoderma harzianum]